MNVVKIVVDEIPESCRDCKYWKHTTDYYHLHCSAIDRDLDRNYMEIMPSWCPLQLEEVCEWKKDNDSKTRIYNIDNYKYVSPHDFDFVYSRQLNNSNKQFCPNCGNRIKYVEVE